MPIGRSGRINRVSGEGMGMGGGVGRGGSTQRVILLTARGRVLVARSHSSRALDTRIRHSLTKVVSPPPQTPPSDADHSGSSVSTSSEMLGLSPPTVNHPATQKPTWPDEMNAGQGGTLRIICLDFTVTSS